MKKNKCSEKFEIFQCCRYSYGIIKNTTIKNVLLKNKWMFKETFRLFTYYSSIKENILPVDAVIGDNHILFSSETHNFDEWINKIDWDFYGTWYVYNFPIMKTLPDEVLILSNGYEIPINKKERFWLESYYDLEKEWKFIHDLHPDVFISKKGNDVIVGAIDNYHVWVVNRNVG